VVDVKDKNKVCPKCKQPMKYKGSKIFYCKNCKVSRQYGQTIEVKKGLWRKTKDVKKWSWS